MEPDFVHIGVRLGAAALAGAVIGINRDLAQKPIGVRTLGLVALGAATVTVAGITVPGMAEHADSMSRVVQGVIQGIMAGISFIGAGVILRDPKSWTVEGLTTAASVWVTAAIGIACGLGAWTVVLGGVAIALALLIVVGWVEDVFHLKHSREVGTRPAAAEPPAADGRAGSHSRAGSAAQSPVGHLPLGF